MQSSMGGIQSSRFLPYLKYISAALIIYGAVGVAVNLRLPALIIEALTGWFGGKSAYDAPLSIGILGPLQVHYDARPWLPWAAWLLGAALFALLPRSTSLPVSVVEEASTPAPKSNFLRTHWPALVSLFALLLLGGIARMIELWPQSYGLTRFPYDDEGVYAGAAQLFLQGIIPYRDYFFAHPPIAAIAYAPAMAYHFTEWGSPTSFIIARYLSVFYSLVTLALIFLIAYRLAGLWGGVISGLLWAVDGRVVEINRKVMLEGPLVLLSCGAVLLYLWVRPALSVATSDNSHVPKRPFLLLSVAGAVAALSALTKIAGLACLLAIVADMVWLRLEQRRPPQTEPQPAVNFRAQLAALGLGVLAAVVVALGPFLVLAPTQFIREVLFFQLLRPSDGVIDIPSRIGDITSNLTNALTPLIATIGFAVLSLWAWRCRALGPWRIIILWTFFSLLLFTYSRSFYQHYYIQLAAPLCLLGAGVSLLPRQRTEDEERKTTEDSAKRETRNEKRETRNATDTQVVVSSLVSRFSFLVSRFVPQSAIILALPLLVLQWSGLSTRDCPHCQDPLFVVVGRYVNNAVPPGAPVLATDEQFNILAARPPSRSSTGYLIDSYGHMIYLGLGLSTRDWGDLLSAALRGEHSDDVYAVMQRPAPQADFLLRASQAALIVVHSEGFARLTDATARSLAEQYKIAEKQSRYTIYRGK